TGGQRSAVQVRSVENCTSICESLVREGLRPCTSQWGWKGDKEGGGRGRGASGDVHLDASRPAIPGLFRDHPVRRVRFFQSCPFAEAWSAAINPRNCGSGHSSAW